MKKKNKEIKLELTFPAEGKVILWAVVPEGKYERYPYERWFKIEEYMEWNPPAPDPNLVSWVTRDGGP